MRAEVAISDSIDTSWCIPPRSIWGGHSDVVAGVVCGRRELIARIDGVFPLLGGKLSPFEGWLLVRGLRTLPLRMRRHHASGLAIARRLAEQAAVRRVHHPLLGEPGPGAGTLAGAPSSELSPLHVGGWPQSSGSGIGRMQHSGAALAVFSVIVLWL